MCSHLSVQGVSSTSQFSSCNSHFLPNGNETKSLNVCFSNVRSLLPKVDEFRLTCLSLEWYLRCHWNMAVRRNSWRWSACSWLFRVMARPLQAWWWHCPVYQRELKFSGASSPRASKCYWANDSASLFNGVYFFHRCFLYTPKFPCFYWYFVSCFTVTESVFFVNLFWLVTSTLTCWVHQLLFLVTFLLFLIVFVCHRLSTCLLILLQMVASHLST